MTTPEPYDVVAVNLEPDADNRIHADDVAQSFGFTGALVPGVELFALATAPLVAAWGERFLAGGRARCASAVRSTTESGCGSRRPRADGSFDLALAGPDGEPRTVGRRPRAGAAGAAGGSYALALLPDVLAEAPVPGVRSGRCPRPPTPTPCAATPPPSATRPGCTPRSCTPVSCCGS